MNKTNTSVARIDSFLKKKVAKLKPAAIGNPAGNHSFSPLLSQARRHNNQEGLSHNHASPSLEAKLLRDIDLAIEKEELFLLYQPIWSSHEDRIVGSEALVRWRNPQRGLVMPDEFIPYAEKKLHTMLSLDDWVAKKAFGQAKACFSQTAETWRQAINISARELEQIDFPCRLLCILNEVGLNSHNTELEITERWEFKNFDKAIGVLQELREIGFQISIDDFGTGFSSLACLGRLPVDRVKIARELIQDCTHNPRSTVVVKGVISLAEQLNIDVLAEGIETQEQFDLLKAMGCKEFQGYFFGRPMPHGELAKTI